MLYLYEYYFSCFRLVAAFGGIVPTRHHPVLPATCYLLCVIACAATVSGPPHLPYVLPPCEKHPGACGLALCSLPHAPISPENGWNSTAAGRHVHRRRKMALASAPASTALHLVALTACCSAQRLRMLDTAGMALNVHLVPQGHPPPRLNSRVR